MASNPKCAGCHQELPDRQFLTCVECKNSYDLECANVSTMRYYNTMQPEHKATWKCPACYCKMRKIGNTNTPVRKQDHDTIKNITMSEKSNITQRDKTRISHDDTLNSINSSISGDTIHAERSNIGNELTLQNLNELIVLRLKENNNSIINGLKDTIKMEINKAIGKLKEETKHDTDILYKENDQRKIDIEKINIEINRLQKENDKLKNELNTLTTQTSASQNYVPENNSKKFVLYGLDEYYNEPDYILHDRVIQIFRDILHVDLLGYIEDTYRIGKHTNNNRPLVIELISKRMTKYIIENRTYFKGSKLSISELLDENARRLKKNMREEMFMARRQGLHAVIRGNQLYIEGKKVNTKHETHKDLTTNRINMKTKSQSSSDDVRNEEHRNNSFRYNIFPQNNNNSFRDNDYFQKY